MGPVAILICLVAAAAPSAASSTQPDAWAVLADGGSGGFRWQVRIEHQSGAPGAAPLGAQRPCLVARTTWRLDPLTLYRSRSRECVNLSRRLDRTAPPLVVSGGQPSGGGQGTRSAIGIVFAPQARRAQVTFCDGSTETIPLDRLSPEQAGSTGLAPFRYAAFSIRGEWCAARIVGRDAGGHVLWDSGTEDPA